MVKIENTHDWDVEIHWFNLLTDGTWQFVHKEKLAKGNSKKCYVSEYYYFKLVKA